MRLGVSQRLALIVPILFVASNLCAYAATNRLLTDPVNYALFVFIFAAWFAPFPREEPAAGGELLRAH